jgi:transposase InsO family protein
VKKICGVLEELPFYEYRKVFRELVRKGVEITEKQVRRIMKRAGLPALYPGKYRSKSAKEQVQYPYLLRDTVIGLANQVWATDIILYQGQGRPCIFGRYYRPVPQKSSLLAGIEYILKAEQDFPP